MTIPEIVKALTVYSGAFPRQAVLQAVAQREEVTPHLLQIMIDATSNIREIARQEDYLGHIYAMYLLSQFREKRAYKPMVDFVTAEWDAVDRALGDVITEDLGRMFASICNGDTALICGMIEDATLNEYIRGAGLDAFVVLVAQGAMAREEVLTYFRSLFLEKLERKHGFIWGSLVSSCCDIYPGEAVSEIEMAFAAGLVDTGYVGRQDVKRDLTMGKERALERLAADAHHTFIDDTISEMSYWPCFQQSRREPVTPMLEQFRLAAPVQNMPNVGRNAPCPCGSNKKYKMCCGA